MTETAAGRTGQRRVLLGKILAHFGVEGWLKIESYTEPRKQIFDYHPLYLDSEAIEDFEGKVHGKGLLIRIAGQRCREAAEELLGRPIWVNREQLPASAPGEYYWSDLEGCRVVNTSGHDFGTVKRIMATGGNDVLVVMGRRETLIPFVHGSYVLRVDLDERRILVDWEPDYL